MSAEALGSDARRWLRAATTLIVAVWLAVGLYGASGTLAAGTPTTTKATVGWPGGITAYEGRYRLTSAGDASFASSGTLTIFGRFVPHQSKPQMSGILSLYSSGGTNVLYLTHFVHTGSKLSARAILGIYTGPEIGSFVVVSHEGAALVVHFVPLQGAPILLHFTRISTNPHP